MKKLLLLLSATLLLSFFSCGSDDDNSSSADPIIGLWVFYKYYENNVEIDIEACEKQKRFQYLESNLAKYRYYAEDDDGICHVQPPISGSWQNLGGGEYLIEGANEGPISAVITFQDDTYYYELQDDGIAKKVVFKKE